jgi:predicted amidohydrolase
MVVARSNVVVTENPKEVGYGDSFIISPQGEMLAQAELFRTEILTSKITPKLFEYPVVWADLGETPAFLKAMLGRLLLKGGAPEP